MRDKWAISFVNEKSEKEVLSLSIDLQAKFLRVGELLQDFGPHEIGLPHVRPLEKKLWELRLKGKDNIARSIYVLASKRRIVILHTFIKKTQKTPSKAIKIALSRLEEIEND